MITLFVDTNILLSFYHLTSDDVEELRKVLALIETGKIKLVLTEQVKDEFMRNRSAKIVDAMKKLQEVKFSISFPAFAKDYQQYAELRTLVDQAGKKHSELVKRMTDVAKDGNLKANALIGDLFKKANVIALTNEIYLSAVKRIRRPPGKENSSGDAINWECLLSVIDDWTDVHLVSEDKDYRSQLSPSELDDFLDYEWSERKNSAIVFYTKISDFFKTNFPDIKIASEFERDHLIEQLSNSGSFARTHIVIAKLSKRTDFSATQIEELVQIARSNSQVGWIVGDSDVHPFDQSLLKHKVRESRGSTPSSSERGAAGRGAEAEWDNVPF